MFSCLTWLKVVEPSVRMGDRTWALDITWMRKTSASRGRQSFRNARNIRFSPFWLKISMPDNILEARRRTREACNQKGDSSIVESWSSARVSTSHTRQDRVHLKPDQRELVYEVPSPFSSLNKSLFSMVSELAKSGILPLHTLS
jgi:hypothetical protein